jgi:hypothetical protein
MHQDYVQLTGMQSLQSWEELLHAVSRRYRAFHIIEQGPQDTIPPPAK